MASTKNEPLSLPSAIITSAEWLGVVVVVEDQADVEVVDEDAGGGVDQLLVGAVGQHLGRARERGGGAVVGPEVGEGAAVGVVVVLVGADDEVELCRRR